MRAAALRWVGLALLGLAVAAAVSVAASRLVSQQIGLASQPISAGDALAPEAAAGEQGRRRRAERRGRREEAPRGVDRGLTTAAPGGYADGPAVPAEEPPKSQPRAPGDDPSAERTPSSPKPPQTEPEASSPPAVPAPATTTPGGPSPGEDGEEQELPDD